MSIDASRRRGRRALAHSRPRRCRTPEVDSLEIRRLPTAYVVNSLADILAPPPGVVTLRSAIAMANASAAPGIIDAIELSVAGTYAITALYNGELAITGAVDYNLKIENASGGRAIIDGGGLNRVFDINPGLDSVAPTNVIFSGLTITGGNANGNGGGIRCQGGLNVILDDVNLTGNYASGDGGGLYISNGSLAIDRGTIAGNVANSSGGGIYSLGDHRLSTGNVAISDAIFQGNIATSPGGALAINGGDLSAAGTRFTGNVASFGGAIDDQAYDLALQYCTLDRNRAIGDAATGFGGGGGALNVEPAAFVDAVSIANSLLLDNAATFEGKGAGGAIVQDSGRLTILNSRLSGNRADGPGGALYFTGATLTMNGTTIDHSRSGYRGGGLFFLGRFGASTLTNDTFTANSSLDLGGGINDEGLGSLILLHDTINANFSAYLGGGVALAFAGVLTVGDSIIAQNTVAPDLLGADVLNNNDTKVTDDGGNLIGDATGSQGFVPSPLIGTTSHPIAPGLGPLLANGSPPPFTPYTVDGLAAAYEAGTPADLQPVPTEALLTDSPAFRAGVATATPTTDGRGFARPSGNPSIGAYEPQYAASATPSQVYVENLYEVLLHRPADPGGLAHWTALVDTASGVNVDLVQAFESSTEYRQGQINLFYAKYLGRAVEPGGLGGWLVFLDHGGNLTQVKASILGSHEYALDHGGSPGAVVESLFRDVLGRVPGPEEVDEWLRAVQGGSSQVAVATAFLVSDEYRDDLIQSGYESGLGRAASPPEVTLWFAFLANSTDPQALLTRGIEGSAEALALRTTGSP